jgi:hypothetical protein
VTSLGLRREGVSRQDIRSDPNQTLAEILAAVQPSDRTRCQLDSVEDVLSIADLSVAHPALEFLQCLGTALDMVKDEETLRDIGDPVRRRETLRLPRRAASMAWASVLSLEGQSGIKTTLWLHARCCFASLVTGRECRPSNASASFNHPSSR